MSKTDNDIERQLEELYDDFIENYTRCTDSTCSLTDDDESTYADESDDDEAYDFTVDPITIRVPTAKCPAPKYRSMIPTTLMLAKTISSCSSARLMRVLFDSGGTKTMIHKRVLPEMVQPKPLQEAKAIRTLAGSLVANAQVTLRGLCLPEFDKNRIVDEQKALVFDAPCRYDIIIGQDFLHKVGIDICYSNATVAWYGNDIPMRHQDFDDRLDFECVVNDHVMQIEDEFFEQEFSDDSFLAAPILDAKYEKLNVEEFISQQSHLNSDERNDIRKLLDKHDTLFDGKLRVYPHKKVHLELEEGAKPVHARAYPVPRVHEPVFKRELDHLVQKGVISPQGSSEWACGTFISPKKDGRVRWISDLRELNKVIKCRVYPLPTIQDVLRRRKGYRYFTKLDISMQYYTFELDEASKDLCTIVTPFGKYKYNRLAMGLKCAPDFAQEVMENVLHGIENTEIYIDDICVFSNSWEEHVALLDRILNRLKENGFAINPLKCEWAVQETDWLGYWLTPNGLKPWKKKIDAILKMQCPRTLSQLRSFIGAVNFYRDM